MALAVKNLPANAGGLRDTCSVPWSGRSLEESVATHSSTLAWTIPIDRGDWQASVHGVAKSPQQD